jgi:N-methylhydantoinase B
MGAGVPENSGLYRTIDVVAPEGSIVNATHPMAVGSRGLTLYRIADALLGALTPVAPNRMMVAGDGGPLMLVISGQREGHEPFVFLDLVTGGWGARPNADGMEGVPHIGVNHSNSPIEVVEAEFPIRMHAYEMVSDSEGAGMFRGCLSTHRSYEVLAPCSVVVRSDRRLHRAWGLEGGTSGSPSKAWVDRSDGSRQELPSKAVLTLSPGDTFHYVSPSGGGWGPPLERSRELVLEDVLDQKVTLERATSVYGLSAS